VSLDRPLILVGALKDAFRAVGVSKASFRASSDPKGAFRTGKAARHAGNTIGGSRVSVRNAAFGAAPRNRTGVVR
jgi:hypothetical protein